MNTLTGGTCTTCGRVPWPATSVSRRVRESGELVEELLKAEVPAARANTVGEALADKQAEARDIIVALPTHDGQSFGVSGNPSESTGVRPDSDLEAAGPLCTDTVDVLMSVAGCKLENVQDMQASGAIGPCVHE